MDPQVEILQQHVNILKNVAFFNGIYELDLARIAEVMDEVTIPEGGHILTEGEPVKGLYVITEGFINVLVNHQVVRASLPAGESYGEMSCLSSQSSPATATIIAVSPVKALYISRDDVKPIANRIPQIWETAWEKITNRLSFAGNRFSEILDHTHLIRLDQAGTIAGEMSKMCSTILGIPVPEIAGNNFSEFMFSREENVKLQQDWNSAYSLLFQGFASDAVLDMIPNQVRFIRPDGEEIYLLFKYLPCYDLRGNFESVHVNLKDITTEKLLEQKSKELEQEKRVRDKIYEQPEGFLQLLDLVKEVIIGTKQVLEEPASVDFDHFKRVLHTVKGGAGLFNLDGLQHSAHYLEELLLDEENLSQNPIEKALENFQQEQIVANAFFHSIDPELQKRLTGTIISIDQYTGLKAAIREKSFVKIKHILKELDALPLSKVVFGWEDLIYRLGEKLFKDIEFETKNLDDIFLPHKVIEQLSSSLIHIIRNAIDHGIETPAEREKIGKSPKAKISVHATESDSEIVLKITDDGKGINPNKIIEMAKKKAELGLISKIYIDKLIQKGKVASLLFCSGFSTAQEVSNISGRGIGMGAVHSTIQELSGSLKVQSKQGKGTSIIISIPKLDD